jgi:hypothetical protein
MMPTPPPLKPDSIAASVNSGPTPPVDVPPPARAPTSSQPQSRPPQQQPVPSKDQLIQFGKESNAKGVPLDTIIGHAKTLGVDLTPEDFGVTKPAPSPDAAPTPAPIKAPAKATAQAPAPDLQFDIMGNPTGAPAGNPTMPAGTGGGGLMDILKSLFGG